MKEKSDIKPVIVKVGLALALSFASFIYSRFISRRVKPPLTPPQSSSRSSDFVKEIDPRRKDESETNKRTMPYSYGVPSVPSERLDEGYLNKLGGDNSVVGLSHIAKNVGDRQVLHSPEFNDPVKELDSYSDVGICSSDVLNTSRVFVSTQKGEHEQEMNQLQDMVKTLHERETNLEAQLLEFHGLKEQERTVVELHNRLKLNQMKAKLFSLKIESLRAENQRLEAQVAGNAKMVVELDAARANIRVLKKKLRFQAHENKEQILNLKQRVAKLEDEEYKSLASDSDVESKLKRIRELEGEIEELKGFNAMMQLENTDLARKLESTQILASSILEDPKADTLREDSSHLREENEDLKNKIEQLQADRCCDIEELVYLRWINACLRYELRDYQPADGKTGARDLSKTLSPKSEEKAKQLILDYANTHATGEREINFVDFDSDQCSSSHTYLTDSSERDESSFDNSSAAKTITSSRGKKLFNKLRKLLRGNHIDRPEPIEKGNLLRYSSSISTADHGAVENTKSFAATSSDTLSRLSLDLPRPKNLKQGHVLDMERGHTNSSSRVYKAFVLGGESSTDSTHKDEINKHADCAQSEVLKYAAALGSSRRGSLTLHRKSASYGF